MYQLPQAAPRLLPKCLSLHASPCSVTFLSAMAEGAAQEWVACRPQLMSSPAAQDTSCLDQAVLRSHLYPHCSLFLCTSVPIVWVCVFLQKPPRDILYNFVHCAALPVLKPFSSDVYLRPVFSLVSSFHECGADQNCG